VSQLLLSWLFAFIDVEFALVRFEWTYFACEQLRVHSVPLCFLLLCYSVNSFHCIEYYGCFVAYEVATVFFSYYVCYWAIVRMTRGYACGELSKCLNVIFIVCIESVLIFILLNVCSSIMISDCVNAESYHWMADVKKNCLHKYSSYEGCDCFDKSVACIWPCIVAGVCVTVIFLVDHVDFTTYLVMTGYTDCCKVI